MNIREKRVKTLLKRAEKMGLDIDKITEGKAFKTLAHNSKTVANMEKRYNRQKERKRIKKQNAKIDRQLGMSSEEKKIDNRRDYKRRVITTETKSELLWNHNIDEKDINIKTLENKTEKALDKFFNTYFKEIKNNYESQKLMDKMKSRFGVRLDLAYKFMEYVGNLSFKYPIPKEIMKTDTPLEYSKLMHERLEKFERIIGKEFDI